MVIHCDTINPNGDMPVFLLILARAKVLCAPFSFDTQECERVQNSTFAPRQGIWNIWKLWSLRPLQRCIEVRINPLTPVKAMRGEGEGVQEPGSVLCCRHHIGPSGLSLAELSLPRCSLVTGGWLRSSVLLCNRMVILVYLVRASAVFSTFSLHWVIYGKE